MLQAVHTPTHGQIFVGTEDACHKFMEENPEKCRRAYLGKVTKQPTTTITSIALENKEKSLFERIFRK